MRQKSHPIIDWMEGATPKEIKGLVAACRVTETYLRHEVAKGRRKLSAEAARRIFDYTTEATPGRVLTLEALLPPDAPPATDQAPCLPSALS